MEQRKETPSRPMALAAQETVSRFRSLKGGLRIWNRVLLLAIGVSGLLFALRIHTHLGLPLWREQFVGLFFGAALASFFLSVPIRKSGPWDRVPWYDFLAHCLSLVIGIYIYYRIPPLQLGYFNMTDGVLGVVAISLTVEAVRRSIGPVLVGLTVASVLYMLFGYLLPGEFVGISFPWNKVFAYLMLDQGAIPGITLYVVCSIVIAYFLLAEVLVVLGGQEFLIDFAASTMGRFRGGPAKVAVLASSLFGTLSGSTVANVVFVGSMTIPMMKKTGYPPHVAGAIEAAASNGGQIMPPMMGVTAFIMASFLAMPYAQICIAAAIPAIAYYIPLLIQTDLEAAKSNIKGLPPTAYPPLRKTLKKIYLFAVPLVSLVYFLFVRQLDPEIAGAYTVLVGILMGLVVKWKGIAMLRAVPAIFENAARALLEITVLSLVAGIVMGALAQSGLGVTFGLMVVRITEATGIWVTLFVVAAVSIVLGMGLPTPIVYIFLATLLGVGLEQAGLPRLASHLFVFYFGVMAMVTPPVALAAYAAAAIAGSGYFKTGWRATRMSIAAYVVPFLFVFQPALLMQGSAADIIAVFLLVVILSGCLSVIMVVHSLFAPVTWYELLVLVANCGLICYLIIYGSHVYWWPAIFVTGAILFAILLKGKLYRRVTYQAIKQQASASDDDSS